MDKPPVSYGRRQEAVARSNRMQPMGLCLRPAERQRVEQIAALHGISVSQCLRVLLKRAIDAPASAPPPPDQPPAPQELLAAASRTDREHQVPRRLAVRVVRQAAIVTPQRRSGGGPGA